VLGSCNNVVQNVKAVDGATISINNYNCVAEKPEDSFLLRYVWLRAQPSSFLVAGHFDPALARLLPENPVVVRNAVFEKLQEIVTRFGRPFSPKEDFRYSYTLPSKGQQTDNDPRIDARWQKPSDFPKKLRIYEDEEDIIWPDVPSLRAIFKSQDWPSNYRIFYTENAESKDWKKPQSSMEFQNAAMTCVLLHASVSRELPMNYWDSMAALANEVAKKEFKLQQVI
jgi:hypothetical protein